MKQPNYWLSPAAGAVVCAILILAFPPPARAVGAQLLRGHLPPGISRMTPLGQMEATNRLRLVIGLPQRNQAELDTLLEQICDPTSPQYRHYLTPAEFAQRFGPSEADYAAVAEFVSAHHLSITAPAPANRAIMDVEGSVADIETALHVKMQRYQHPREKRTFYAPDTEPSVDLNVSILHISGLDDFVKPHPKSAIKAVPHGSNGAAKGTGSGTGGTYMGDDFRNAYAPGVALTGAGQKVALFELDGFYMSDILAYEAQAKLVPVPVTTVLLDGLNGTPLSVGGNGEVSLDIDMVVSMAPGLDEVIVYEGLSPDDVLNQMAIDNSAAQISCSWGWSPQDPIVDTCFKQYAAQGQSFYSASGDDGAELAADIMPPTDNPYITQVGGTTLTTTGPHGAWVSDVVWSWFATTGQPNASTGGYGSIYTLPIWQKGISMTVNGGSINYRNFPDVALTADNILVIYDQNQSGSFGGTSAAAPLWAAFNALINQQGSFYGYPPVGFVCPSIYALAKGPLYRTLLHDVTLGNNTNLTYSNQFFACQGYDLCTGWGTPTGSNLINALAPPLNIPVLRVVTNVISGGNGNGVIDNDECNNLTFIVTNEGFVAATGIHGTLYSTTMGAVVGQSTANFPTLLPGASAASSSPFTLSTEPSFVCGTPINLVLVLTSDQAVRTNLVQIPSGIVGSPLVFANTTPVQIPPGFPAGLSSFVIVTNLASAAKITVSVYAQAAVDGGLKLQLISPNGTTNILASFVGGSGVNFGVGCSPGGQTTFDDGASNSIVSGTAPFVGSFQPQQPLASLLPISGANLNGLWQLNVVDSIPGQGATVECWSLNVTPYYCVEGGGRCPGSDLYLSMTAMPDPVIVGSNEVFTLSVSNAGPSPADNVVISQTLPPGFAFVTTSNYPVQVISAGSQLTFSLGTLPVYGAANIAVVTTPFLPGQATSTASTTSSSPNLNPNHGMASVSTIVTLPTADLAVSMSASTGSLLQGGQVTFTMVVTNNGPFTAMGVVLTNELPATVVYVSSSNMNPGGLLADLGDLPVGSNAVATVTVSPTVTGSITDTAQVGLSALESDLNSLNNSANFTVTVGPSADLAVSASATPATVIAGQNCIYVATVANNGPSGASDVVFSQTIPGGTGLNSATFVSSNPTNVTVTNGIITWNIGSLASGGSKVITNVLKTPIIQSGGRPITMSSIFTVSGQPGDANTNNNVVTLQNLVETPTITIVPAGVTLVSQSGSALNGAINPGETVGVEFYLQNTGNIAPGNLMATLQATGGVTANSGPQSYGSLAPGGAPVGQAFTFTASGTNGGTVVATLSLQDGSTSLGTVAYNFFLPVVRTFWNTNPIYIPNTNHVLYPEAEGPASPYPSIIQVSNITGYVSKVTVTVSNMYHTYPSDIGILLAGPETNVVLMDAALLYGAGITGTTLTFDSTAANVQPAEGLPGDGTLISGLSYMPADYNPSDVFTNAAAPPYSTDLGILNGLPANGAWMLYAHDDAPGDSGGISNGWSVTITTVTPVNSTNNLTPAYLQAGNVAGGLQLTLQGQPGQDYAIQISSNLLNWTSVLTNTASLSNGTFNYTDTQTNAPARFYRTVRVP